MSSFRLSLLVTALALGLGPWGATEARAASVSPTAKPLAPLATPTSLKVTTKAGTPVAVWLFPSPKVSDLPASGQVVLIAFDAGDGVSIAPLVQLLQGLGAAVVVFDNPLVGFDNPLAGFDNPLVGFDNPLVAHEKVEGDMGVASEGSGEQATDVVHAMVTWAATHAVGDGVRHRVHLFGIGRGAELALEVGASRTGELASILLDTPSAAAATAITSKHGAQGAVDGAPLGGRYAGVRVLRATKLPKHLAPSKIDGIAVAAKATSYPTTATIADIVTDAGYQQGVADALSG